METSKDLEDALSRRFFPHVERMGFIRDDRQGPQITCFRRQDGDAMQIFAVLRDPKGHARFSVMFTEAPLAGIDYGGKWLAAHDIFPGSFALPQGWLRPKPGNMWFGVRGTLWSRLAGKQQDARGQAVAPAVVLRYGAWSSSHFLNETCFEGKLSELLQCVDMKLEQAAYELMLVTSEVIDRDGVSFEDLQSGAVEL